MGRTAQNGDREALLATLSAPSLEPPGTRRHTFKRDERLRVEVEETEKSG